MKGLLKKGVFKLVNPKNILQGNRVFNFRFINKIKNSSTDKAFKKSRLVIQAYNNYVYKLCDKIKTLHKERK